RLLIRPAVQLLPQLLAAVPERGRLRHLHPVVRQHAAVRGDRRRRRDRALRLRRLRFLPVLVPQLEGAVLPDPRRLAGADHRADRAVPAPAAVLARRAAARQHRELIPEAFIVAAITVRELSKVYATGVKALDALDLDVADGEFVVLVGPSGCGKTTALRMVAGLERITSGTISFGDRVVNDVSPRHRDVAMVFQNYALYPHLSVYQNIGFALENQQGAKAERDRPLPAAP